MSRFVKTPFALLLCVLLIACTHLRPQPAKEALEPAPILECKKNLTCEMTSNPVAIHKTWIKYDNLDYNKAYNAAIFSLQKAGHSITAIERQSGTIHGQVVSRSGQQTPYPIDVKVTRENASLIVYVSQRSTDEGKTQVNLCGFYQEFENQVKESQVAPGGEEQVRLLPKPANPVQFLTPEAQQPATPVEPELGAKPVSVSSPSPSPQPSSLRVTEVSWGSVNLREGPGMKHKIIGNARKGTSFRVLDVKGDWLRVQLENGKEVWVSKSATVEASKTSSPASANLPPSPPPSSSKRGTSKPLSPM